MPNAGVSRGRRELSHPGEVQNPSIEPSRGIDLESDEVLERERASRLDARNAYPPRHVTHDGR